MSDDFTRFRMIWIDQVWADKELTSTARDIAMRIGTRFNRKRYNDTGAFMAWPSYETIANEAGCSGKTVQRAVMMLKERGHLMTVGAGGRHCSLTYYAIRKTDNATHDGAEAGEKGGHPCPAFDVTRDICDKKVDTGVPKGGHLKPQKVDTSVLQTLLIKPIDEPLDIPREEISASPARSPIGVIVLSILAAGPTCNAPLPPYLRGKEDILPDHVKLHQAEHGWPDLHVRCQDTSLRTEAMARMALEMEPVATDGDLWQAWKVEYRRRGWPMPTPLDGKACFPEGGPIKLEKFLDRMKLLMINGVVDNSRNVVRLAAGRGNR